MRKREKSAKNVKNREKKHSDREVKLRSASRLV